MQNQTAKIIWREGEVPVSTQFDDPYFSLENGLDETRHVFLAGNDLPGRFRDGFRIAELGFGTGLNFLTTLQSWRASGVRGAFHFTSFEAYPMTRADMSKALGGFDGLGDLAAELLDQWHPEEATYEFGDEARLTVLIGDARDRLAAWDGMADAWYLDGFSPAKNPELWGADLMAQVAQHTVAGGTFATYSAAGFVRMALADAGFDVARIPGYGRKRHMTQGRIPL